MPFHRQWPLGRVARPKPPPTARTCTTSTATTTARQDSATQSWQTTARPFPRSKCAPQTKHAASQPNKPVTTANRHHATAYVSSVGILLLCIFSTDVCRNQMTAPKKRYKLAARQYSAPANGFNRVPPTATLDLAPTRHVATSLLLLCVPPLAVAQMAVPPRTTSCASAKEQVRA